MSFFPWNKANKKHKEKNREKSGDVAGDSFKSVEDDTAPKDAVDGGTNGAKDGVGGKNLKDGENGAVEKDSPSINVPSTANAETPTKSSKLSIFGSKDKKDKADKNASDKDKSTNMPLGLGGKPKGATSDGFDGMPYILTPTLLNILRYLDYVKYIIYNYSSKQGKRLICK